ncbi:MAG: trypsin-like serine protease [Proteobacteria bacterium]|nr:MAG: trypsin-like serine protease [Pseudomonadota bacterium]
MRTRNILITLSLALLISSSDSFALIIGPQVREGGQDASCFLSTKNNRGEASYGCTGTLIAPNVVRTARHCVLHDELEYENRPADQIQIQCGYLSAVAPDSDQDFQMVSQFKETFVSSNYFYEPVSENEFKDLETYSKRDYALIILPENSKLTPIKPVLPLELDALLARSDLECRVEGYGLSKNGYWGMLKHSPVQLPRSVNGRLVQHNVLQSSSQSTPVKSIVDLFERLIGQSRESYLPYITTREQTPTQILTGDSGGGLFCKSKHEAQWKLVGSASLASVGLNMLDKRGFLSQMGLKPLPKIRDAVPESAWASIELGNVWIPNFPVSQK